MALDIEALRYVTGDYYQTIADAQFRKLAWGIQDWLELTRFDDAVPSWLLESALEQADIKRPEEVEA